jgi:hypothetical protein
LCRYHVLTESIADILRESIWSVEAPGQADHRKHSCRSPASGRDGCCRFSLRKSEEVMGIKIRAFKESLLGIVKVFEDAGY